MANKWGRRQKRLQEKHRWYFEAVAARVVATGHATLDLGVTSLDVSLQRSMHTFGRRLWLEIVSGGGGHTEGAVSGHGRDLVSVIADYMILHAADFPGVQVPPHPLQAD